MHFYIKISPFLQPLHNQPVIAPFSLKSTPFQGRIHLLPRQIATTVEILYVSCVSPSNLRFFSSFDMASSSSSNLPITTTPNVSENLLPRSLRAFTHQIA